MPHSASMIPAPTQKLGAPVILAPGEDGRISRACWPGQLQVSERSCFKNKMDTVKKDIQCQPLASTHMCTNMCIHACITYIHTYKHNREMGGRERENKYPVYLFKSEASTAKVKYLALKQGCPSHSSLTAVVSSPFSSLPSSKAEVKCHTKFKCNCEIYSFKFLCWFPWQQL